MSWRRIAKAPAFPERVVCDRLILRPFRHGDANDLFAYANDEVWSRYITPPFPYQRDYADQFVEERINGHSNGWAGWCVDLDDRMIGSIDLILEPAHRSAEMAYSLARADWNKGLMTEALAATIDAVFHMKNPLNRLCVRIDTRNQVSLQVIKKLGFRREGLLRQNRWHKGQFVDDVVLGLLRNEHERR